MTQGNILLCDDTYVWCYYRNLVISLCDGQHSVSAPWCSPWAFQRNARCKRMHEHYPAIRFQIIPRGVLNICIYIVNHDNLDIKLQWCQWHRYQSTSHHCELILRRNVAVNKNDCNYFFRCGILPRQFV